MKVLYVAEPDRVHPWYEDFLASIDNKYPVEFFDWEKPFSEQLQDVGVVVELGGAHNTPERIDLAMAAGVKLWQISGTGLDHVDLESFWSRKLPLANTPGQFSSIPLGEHALFFMLFLSKKQYTMRKILEKGLISQPVTEELHSAKLGLIGFGASARELAKRAVPFGMRIMAIDVANVSQEVLDQHGVEFFGGIEGIDRVLSEADYLSLHVPLTAQTQHMIGARELALMKQTAAIINVSRGELIDEKALIEALQLGKIAGAGLDVFSQEPVSADHPLLQMENVIATPHVAGASYGTSRRRGQVCAENVDRTARGQSPLYLVTRPGV